MMRLVAAGGAVIGGLAFWRRKSLKSDAERATKAAKSATARVTAGPARKSLLVKLGEAVYTDRSNPDIDLATEIDRLVIDLSEIDSASDEDNTSEEADTGSADAATSGG